MISLMGTLVVGLMVGLLSCDRGGKPPTPKGTPLVPEPRLVGQENVAAPRAPEPARCLEGLDERGLGSHPDQPVGVLAGELGGADPAGGDEDRRG